MKKIILAIMGILILCLISNAARYRWDGTGPVATPSGRANPGDTINFNYYKDTLQVPNWTFIDDAGGINPFDISEIISTTVGSRDSVIIDLWNVDHIDIIASDSVYIYFNDSLGTPIIMSEYWSEDVKWTIRKIWIFGRATGKVEVHAFKRSFE